MNKEVISDKQAISLIILFIGGSTFLFGIGVEAQQDAWLAILLSILSVFPLLMLYSRILSIHRGRDLFDILELAFGKFFGKIISLLYVWFTIHLGTLVLTDFGDFPTITSITATPKIVLMICIIFLCSWITKEGIEVLGRWGEVSVWVVIVSSIVFVSLLIPNYSINNMEPILYNGVKPVIQGAFGVFSFPFAETVVFCFIFSSLKHKKSSYRVYAIGLINGGVLVLITTLSSILAIGVDSYASFYFPAYKAVSRIDIGYFLQRMEVLISIVFFMGGFIKISICLLGACKGVAKVFELDDYRFIITPITLLMLNLSCLMHENIKDLGEWTAAIWRYYSFPFEVIIPIVIWILIEIKNKPIKT
ncbi:GerAB/ArcD/ProY family transporter [Tepidibacter hydrothermalis]|uniref:Endospore germination permease n=1 Tax=Tepidibacter hydrothermalis TaxID=3036126 RepID=A0ABY8E6Z5_9FIRM|nr:endospore germination permease [Tepidibacter hydrothermalis]WFD08663.1 endospore germination permease [Tepidibacter hydrothermalis]